MSLFPIFLSIIYIFFSMFLYCSVFKRAKRTQFFLQHLFTQFYLNQFCKPNSYENLSKSYLFVLPVTELITLWLFLRSESREYILWILGLLLIHIVPYHFCIISLLFYKINFHIVQKLEFPKKHSSFSVSAIFVDGFCYVIIDWLV